MTGLRRECLHFFLVICIFLHCFCITEPLTSHEFSYLYDAQAKNLHLVLIERFCSHNSLQKREKLNIVYILMKYITCFEVGNMMANAQTIVKGRKNIYNDEMKLFI